MKKDIYIYLKIIPLSLLIGGIWYLATSLNVYINWKYGDALLINQELAIINERLKIQETKNIIFQEEIKAQGYMFKNLKDFCLTNVPYVLISHDTNTGITSLTWNNWKKEKEDALKQLTQLEEQAKKTY